MGTSNPALMIGVQGAGLGYSVGSAYAQAQTQKSVLGYEAQVDANNAAIAGYQADVARQVGQQQEQNAMLKTADLFGAQRAAMAANGVDLGQGSATDVLASTKYMGARDVQTIQDNTNRQVWGFENQRNSYLAEQQAALASSGAIHPWMNAAGTFLGGYGNFASNWYKYNNPRGVPGKYDYSGNMNPTGGTA